MLNFYGKFMLKLSSTLEPLHELLRKTTCWKWGTVQSDVQVHYERKKELVVSWDSSLYGVGAFLAHVMNYGSEKPVLHASRRLFTIERDYGLLDKEALYI